MMLGLQGLYGQNFSPTEQDNLSKLRFDRIDGESVGDVHFDHLVGIFAAA